MPEHDFPLSDSMTALPDLSIPINAPPLITDGPMVFGPSDEPSPHIYVFDAPAAPWWHLSNQQFRFTVGGQGPSFLGVYGPNPPVLSGSYGKLRAPAVGESSSYSAVKSLQSARYYIVVRFESPSLVYTIGASRS